MRRTLRSLLLPFAIAPVMPLMAQAGLLVPTSSGRADDKVLAIREMSIEVGIARGYARVNVQQIFENRTSSVQEGTYHFALPPSASIGDFAIWDGLQRIPGVILEKRRARAIYQELTRQRIDPGLLQQGEEEDQGGRESGSRPSGASLFSVTVSPIPAYATKRLELQFQQETPFIAGLGEFRLVLRPQDAEAPVAHKLSIHVHIGDGAFQPVSSGLPLEADADGASFSGNDVKLDRDLILRIQPKAGEPLQLSAFRNPDGALPDGLALAPWERPSDVPPEKDGFFLLQAIPPGGDAKNSAPAKSVDPARPGQVVVILFDTSLSHRWGGLEVAYGDLVRVLRSLKDSDRFALIPYDRKPAENAQPATPSPAAIEAALSALRERPLGPGADVGQALAAARRLAGDKGRILLLSSGMGATNSKALKAAAGGAALFTVVTNGEAGESLRAASAQVLSPTATEIEGDLFFQRLLAAEVASASAAKSQSSAPFTMSGADPKLRDIYPVLIQPMTQGSLSGWVGRYGAPQLKVHVELASSLLPGGKAALDGALPEKALEARDLPRRWARARVDDLLARIERDGERREWVEEIIALSKRYKFVTPYTAFLAAPRSLLRPRRIQPGDPVLRVECDAGTVAATALLPFGVKLDLVKRPQSDIWEGRFLVPEGLKDGRYPVRILIQDSSGARVSETKHFVLDGTAPTIQPAVPISARAGDLVRITAKADKDVVLLNARVGDAPPIPLRWDAAANCSVGLARIPQGLSGPQEVVFEAVDAAKNRGFARATMEVRP
ncbi:MAG TPA: VIT and VWA domain-containing protein [Holophagaceae bacterium]|jgi:Ca-activated chloride channel family protein|nr:VIT and VWA domain-containing protein [Holophagaceae bacterium]